MKLNCKPGDLAIKVSAKVGDSIPVGAVVQTISHGPIKTFITGEVIFGWEVKYAAKDNPWKGVWACRDEHLRPIRPTEVDDETLTWAGKPEQVTA